MTILSLIGTSFEIQIRDLTFESEMRSKHGSHPAKSFTLLGITRFTGALSWGGFGVRCVEQFQI